VPKCIVSAFCGLAGPATIITCRSHPGTHPRANCIHRHGGCRKIPCGQRAGIAVPMCVNSGLGGIANTAALIPERCTSGQRCDAEDPFSCSIDLPIERNNNRQQTTQATDQGVCLAGATVRSTNPVADTSACRHIFASRYRHYLQLYADVYKHFRMIRKMTTDRKVSDVPKVVGLK
jgi:hypothetical protein